MENNKEKVMLAKKFNQLLKEADRTQLYDHLVAIYEVDDRGIPNSVIVKAQGGPTVVLGMIDILMTKLETLREEVHNKLMHSENMSKNVSEGLSEEIKEKLKGLEMRARKAIEEDNQEEIDNIRNEMKNIFMDALGKSPEDLNVDFGIAEDDDNDNPSFPGDDFNINDFKGM